jgi:hypothetical protein
LISRRKKRRFAIEILHEYDLDANRRFFLLCPTKQPVIPNSDKPELVEVWRNEGSPSSKPELKK